MNQKVYDKIAVIDLDGTLIRGQIQIGLIDFFFSKGIISLFYLIKLNIFYILYKIGFVRKIDSVFDYGVKYLSGMNVSYINQNIDEYIRDRVGKDVFPASFELINGLKKKGYYIIILSSAIDIVVSRIASMFDVDDYVCTQLEKEGDLFTGSIKDSVVYGPEKVNALMGYLLKRNYLFKNVFIEAYADHKSDIPLLRKAHRAFVVNPNKEMKKLSIINNFGIIDMNKL